MSNTLTATLGIILAIILVIIGFYIFGRDKAVETTVTTTSNTSTTTGSVTTTIPASKPTVTTNSTVYPTDTTAILGGSISPHNALTSYWYEYGLSASLGLKNSTQTVGGGTGAIQAPGYITNLTKNTTYFYRLVAENQFGRVTGSTFSFLTTEGNPPPVGSAPKVVSVSANNVTRTGGSLNGEVTPNKAVTEYWFEYGKTVELGNTSAMTSVGSGDAKVSVSLPLSDLTPLTTYYFRLNAQNQFGTINGSILNFKTNGPALSTAPKVTTSSATAIATTTTTLNGSINPNGAVTTYWFEYSTDSSLTGTPVENTEQLTLAVGNTAKTVSINLSGLDGNTTYYFRLVAQNVTGLVRGDKITFKTK
jgi:hypothetical protein